MIQEMFCHLSSWISVILSVWIVMTTADDSQSCKNGGTNESNLHPICTCPPGFKGFDCSQRVRPCEISPCRNRGKCTNNRDGTFSCTCTQRFKGVLCEQRVRPCDSGPCKNGGNCTDDGVRCFKCECPSGFKGSDCSEIVQPCEIKPCKNNGVCMNEKNGKFTCKCSPGFGGTFCDRRDGLFGSKILKDRLKDIGQLERWLNGIMSWKLCYRATENGWGAPYFHRRCDYKKPTVTIIRSGRYIFGAYADVDFGGNTGYRASSKSFIFSFVNKDNLPPFKAPVHRNVNAVYTNPSYGPTFGGGHDIYIANNANAGKSSYTNFGHTYHPPSGYSYNAVQTKNLLAGSYNFTPDEVETFYLY